MKPYRSIRLKALASAVFTLFLLSTLSAQETSTLKKEPTYPGGTPALIDFLVQNIKYPEAAKKANAEGMVVVKFKVGKDGSISGIRTVGKTSKNPRPDFVKEAVRVIRKMPKWIPGEIDGKPAAVEMSLPIKFALS